EPERPSVVVLGGAKVSDKLAVIENLLPKVDRMLVGGGMCFTFLAAQGRSVGSSLVEQDMVDAVAGLMGEYPEKVVLPTDVVVADRLAADAGSKTVGADAIDDGWMGLDIGPATSAAFASIVRGAEAVCWNGPMGVFEWEPCREGTVAGARAMADCDGFTAIGGGDSVAGIREIGLEESVSHVSTGGGARLELLEGRE